MEVTSDGVLRLRYTGNRHDPVLSMSLFGRRWKIVSNSIMSHDHDDIRLDGNPTFAKVRGRFSPTRPVLSWRVKLS